MSRDSFRTLGIDPASTKAEVKAAYRDLAKRHHPDVNPGDATASERFKRITAAYTQALLASAKRDREPQGAARGAGGSSSHSHSRARSPIRTASGPVDPKRYNVREWEKSHYGMHGGSAATEGFDQQSDMVRNLQRQEWARRKAAAAAREARRAAGANTPSFAAWLVPSVVACATVWWLVGYTNRGNPRWVAPVGVSPKRRT